MDDEKLKERAVEFFSRLDVSLIDASLAKVEDSLSEVHDRTYRIFHISFKMYDFKHQAFCLLSEMLKPLGFDVGEISSFPFNPDEKYQKIIQQLEYWNFCNTFMAVIRQLFMTQFDMKNQKNNWALDLQILTSGYFLCQQISLATLRAMKDASQKEGFLWVRGALGSQDALVLEVWESLGTGFRYNYKNLDEISEKSQKVLKMPR